MEDGQQPAAIPDSAAPMETSAPADTSGAPANQPAADTSGNSGNWEQRYKDTQAAYTQNQQKIAALESQLTEYQTSLQELTPAAELAQKMQKVFTGDQEQGPRSVYDYEDGVDGALSEIRNELAELKQAKESLNQATQEQQVWRMQKTFVEDQNRLYQEFGQEHFGSKEAFAEAIKELPKYDPMWESNYLQQPSYDTLKRSFFTMRGAAEHDPSSRLAQVLEAKRKQDFLQKQSNFLGNGTPVSYGPSENPNMPYMSPVEGLE